MEYTKKQSRSRKTATKFNTGRQQSKREEERRYERNQQKEFNRAVRNVKSKPSLIEKIMKRFNRVK